jgi:hypothetical protein
MDSTTISALARLAAAALAAADRDRRDPSGLTPEQRESLSRLDDAAGTPRHFAAAVVAPAGAFARPPTRS